MPVPVEAGRQVAADEPGPAGDRDPHGWTTEATWPTDGAGAEVPRDQAGDRDRSDAEDAASAMPWVVSAPPSHPDATSSRPIVYESVTGIRE